MPESESLNMNRKTRISMTKKKLGLLRNMRDEGNLIQKIARVMVISVILTYTWLARLQDIEIGNV